MENIKPAWHKERFVAMDNEIRCNYPEIFNAIKNPAIIILRKSNYWLFGFASKMVNCIHGGN